MGPGELEPGPDGDTQVKMSVIRNRIATTLGISESGVIVDELGSWVVTGDWQVDGPDLYIITREEREP